MDSINLVPYIEDDRLYDYAAACARTLRPEGMDDGEDVPGIVLYDSYLHKSMCMRVCVR